LPYLTARSQYHFFQRVRRDGLRTRQDFLRVLISAVGGEDVPRSYRAKKRFVNGIAFSSDIHYDALNQHNIFRA
jgi:hypothetical protein